MSYVYAPMRLPSLKPIQLIDNFVYMQKIEKNWTKIELFVNSLLFMGY